jgi:hypothetical protein
MYMALDDEEIRLIFNMANSGEDIAKVKAKLTELKSETQGTGEAVRNLEKELSTFSSSTSSLGQGLTELKGSSGAGGRGVMGASYAFQDFTAVLSQGGENALPRALMSTANNIDAVARSMGASAAAAAKLSMGFTGLVAVLPELIKLAKSAWEYLSGEHVDLEKLKEAQEAWDKLEKTATKAQQAQAGGVKELVTEKPEVLKSVTEAIAQEPGMREEMTASERHKLRRETDAEIQARLNEANLKKAQELLGAATLPGQKGDVARATLQRFAQRMPGAFPDEFGLDIANLSPERQKDMEQWRLDAQGRRMGRKMSDKQADKQAIETKRANEKADAEARELEADGRRANEAEAARQERAGKAEAMAAQKQAAEQARGERGMHDFIRSTQIMTNRVAEHNQMRMAQEQEEAQRQYMQQMKLNHQLQQDQPASFW